MKGGYLIGNWLKSQLKKRGASGLRLYLAGFIGEALAGNVISHLVSGSVTKAVSLLGGKLGALAGPIGVGVGFLTGAL